MKFQVTCPQNPDTLQRWNLKIPGYYRRLMVSLTRGRGYMHIASPSTVGNPDSYPWRIAFGLQRYYQEYQLPCQKGNFSKIPVNFRYDLNSKKRLLPLLRK